MEIGLIRMEWNGVMLPNFLINKLEWQKIRWMIKINEVKCELGEIGFDYDKTFELLQQNAQIWLMSTLWINIYWMKKKTKHWNFVQISRVSLKSYRFVRINTWISWKFLNYVERVKMPKEKMPKEKISMKI